MSKRSKRVRFICDAMKTEDFDRVCKKLVVTSNAVPHIEKASKLWGWDTDTSELENLKKSF